MLREGDELIGQTVEDPEVLHLFFHLLGLGGGNAFGALPALKKALKDEVRARLDSLAAASGLEELSTQGTASQVVDLFHALENRVALGTESLNWIRHEHLYLYRYNKQLKKKCAL